MERPLPCHRQIHRPYQGLLSWQQVARLDTISIEGEHGSESLVLVGKRVVLLNLRPYSSLAGQHGTYISSVGGLWSVRLDWGLEIGGCILKLFPSLTSRNCPLHNLTLQKSAMPLTVCQLPQVEYRNKLVG